MNSSWTCNVDTVKREFENKSCSQAKPCVSLTRSSPGSWLHLTFLFLHWSQAMFCLRCMTTPRTEGNRGAVCDGGISSRGNPKRGQISRKRVPDRGQRYDVGIQGRAEEEKNALCIWGEPKPVAEHMTTEIAENVQL
jgi:hypothetical protein